MPFVLCIELPFASTDFATRPNIGEFGTRPGSVDGEILLATADVVDFQIAAVVEWIRLLDQCEMSRQGTGR